MSSIRAAAQENARYLGIVLCCRTGSTVVRRELDGPAGAPALHDVPRCRRRSSNGARRMVEKPVPKRSGALLALGAAALFGASTPAAKLALATTDPWLAAALLYLGAGIGLGATLLVRRALGWPVREASLRSAELPWLALAVLAGGVLAPVLLMLGLARTDAASASLLLNLEAVATLGLAWIVFKEHVDRRLALGGLYILAGAGLLSWQSSLVIEPGALLVAAACLAWGVDNNLTRKVSHADPIQIAMIKGLTAGSINLGLSSLSGAGLPDLAQGVGIGLVGFLGYGLSLALFVAALRRLGTARTGAYFSFAPFVGTGLGVALLHEPFTWTLALAGAFMAIGLHLHLSEKHSHEHMHEDLDHDHAHVHDDHHQHHRPLGEAIAERHAHRHRHAPLVHGHPHYPDVHHRHPHPKQ